MSSTSPIKRDKRQAVEHRAADVMPGEPNVLPAVLITGAPPAVEGEPKIVGGVRGRSGKFKRGQSGNPRGRPPKPKEEPNEVVRRVLHELISVNVSGKQVPMPMFEALVRSTLALAISDQRASLAVVKMVLATCGPPKTAEILDNDEHAEHVLERFEARLLARLKHEAANDASASRADRSSQDDDPSDDHENGEERSA